MTAPSVREVLETKIALAMNEELCRQIDAKESTDTLNVTSKIVALPCIQSLIEGAATAPTPSAAQWRYEVQHGPEGEAYYAWVFNGDNQLVCTTQTRHAKAIVERMNAPLPAAAVAILRGEEGRHSEFVFTYLVKHPNGGDRGSRQPILPGTLSTAWCRMRDAAGLTGLRLHDLRHTTATRVLRKTGNLVAVQKALGHSRISTTQRYAHMLAEDVRAALDAAAPVAVPVAAQSPVKSPEAKASKSGKRK